MNPSLPFLALALPLNPPPPPPSRLTGTPFLRPERTFFLGSPAVGIFRRGQRASYRCTPSSPRCSQILLIITKWMGLNSDLHHVASNFFLELLPSQDRATSIAPSCPCWASSQHLLYSMTKMTESRVRWLIVSDPLRDFRSDYNRCCCWEMRKFVYIRSHFIYFLDILNRPEAGTYSLTASCTNTIQNRMVCVPILSTPAITQFYPEYLSSSKQ